MAEWLIERGIGETRAALIEAGAIAEMRIVREGVGPRAGEIWDARLTAKLGARRGIVLLGDHEALLEPVPADLAEGGLVRVVVLREPIPERGRSRLAKVRAEGAAGAVPGLITAPAFDPPGARALGHGEALDDYGWGEAIAEAESGHVAFAGGSLALVPTPAMTTIDIDGDLPAVDLAMAGVRAAVAAIRRFDIGGSIGIDLPTLRDKAARQAAGDLVDSLLPQPFERTAVNGFGFLQIVRPRPRASIIERVQNAPVETAALALLHLAARTPGAGPRTLTASPRVVTWLRAHAPFVTELERRIGAQVVLAEDAALALQGGHVHAVQS
ncbi:ribonuclease [Sphingosinicella sp.]|uniref:ribonuclease n=1 Tax=Sphingosinicella sp. TaxID=1917971 RepID=UPI0017CC39C2|nr:ribonuclease [Sphingosinicella sp.]MBA4759166.1 ribonuclease [Sphingosinicella sp.]